MDGGAARRAGQVGGLRRVACGCWPPEAGWYNPAVSTARRFYRLLSGYIGREWDRIRGIIDEYTAEDRLRAIEELDAGTRWPYETPPVTPPPTSRETVQPPVQHTPYSRPPSAGLPQQPHPLDKHYAVLGLASGADFALVRHAYHKFLRRTDPANFGKDSDDAKKAADIRKRVEESYGELRKALDPSAKRFSDLEM
jgi:hypothetical protein